MLEQIDHIGIAVSNLDSAIQFLESALGLHCHKIEDVDSQSVRTAFFELQDVNLELLTPTSSDSPIAKFLDKNGEGIHHIAFRTDDIKNQLNLAEEAGVNIIHREPIEGAEGKLVSFLHPKSTLGVLMELCAAPKSGK